MKTQTQLSGTFLCESEVFNGPICQRQCKRCKGTDETRRIIANKPPKPKRCGLCRRPIRRGMINSCTENHCPRARSEV